MVVLALAATWLAVACWHTNKPLPEGTHVESKWYPIDARDVSFIADITAADAYGRPVVSQAIFDEALRIVRSAHKFIVLDYYLFNAAPLGTSDVSRGALRPIAAELRDALLERRRTDPSLQVLLITDPINQVCGTAALRDLRLLGEAGVAVTLTDLDRLRDSNYLYSSLWRLGVRWWNGPGYHIATAGGFPGPPSGWLPNPLDESDTPVDFGDWARLLNFKANQRDVLVADDGHEGLVAMVGSASPHDASSAHSNTALKIKGPSVWPLLQSELQIARFSGWDGELDAAAPSRADPPAGGARHASPAGGLGSPAPGAEGGGPSSPLARAATGPSSSAPDAEAGPIAPPGGEVKVLTEGAIRAELLQQIEATQRGDNIDVATFRIADRGIIQALIAASRRGVNVRLILDPNREAFGRTKLGIPNQPVASELVTASDGAIHVRWYRTHGEQFHAQLAAVYGPQRLWMTVGSANLTRRNLADYNLEADIAVELPRSAPLALQTLAYFDTLWSNRAALGIEYTADFGYYADPSQLHYWLYRVMEGTGASAF